MDDSSLQTIYRSVIISKLTYASSAWWVFTSATDRQRLEVFIRRSHRIRCVPPDLPAFADICHNYLLPLRTSRLSDHNFIQSLLVSVLFLLSIAFPQLGAFRQQFVKEMCYVLCYTS